jgi:hypothetical protein
MSEETKEKNGSRCGRGKCGGKKLLGLLLLGGIIAATVSLVGCNKWRTCEGKAEWAVSYLSDELDLNDEQTTKLNEIKTEFLEAKKRNESDKEAMVKKLKEMILSEKIEDSDVNTLVETKRKHIDSEIPNFLPKVKAFHASLTSEQKQKAVDLIEEFKNHDR